MVVLARPLIEPYGIETWKHFCTYYRSDTFNWTVWNWNEGGSIPPCCTKDPLIEPYGIETAIEDALGAYAALPLIEPYGIETYKELLLAQLVEGR